MLRSDLTNLNEWMSDRDFDEELHGQIMSIEGTKIGIIFKAMAKDKILYVVDHWERAICMFTTGVESGTDTELVGSDTYDRALNKTLYVTAPIIFSTANLQVGDKIRIRWDVTRLPASRWTGQIINVNISQSGPNTVIMPENAVCELYRVNANGCYLPSGATMYTCDGVDSCNHQHVEQNDREQWKVDKDTLEPIEPLDTKAFDRWGVSKDPLDIPAIRQSEPILITRQGKINALLENTDRTIVISGGTIVKNDATPENLDVKLTMGKAISRRGRVTISRVTSKNTPMIRHFLTNGIPDTDVNIEIDPTKYNDGTNLSAVNPALYYRSLFIVTLNSRIHWVYPVAGYSTILEARNARDPEVPDNIGLHYKAVSLILKGDDTILPTNGGRWINRRSLIHNISNTARHLDEGVA
jgi:hypothetical protein